MEPGTHARGTYSAFPRAHLLELHAGQLHEGANVSVSKIVHAVITHTIVHGKAPSSTALGQVGRCQERRWAADGALCKAGPTNLHLAVKQLKVFACGHLALLEGTLLGHLGR